MFWKNIFYKSICVLFSDYSAVINGTVENGLIVSLFELYHVYVCRKVDIQLYNISMIIASIINSLKYPINDFSLAPRRIIPLEKKGKCEI
jgi:hypothetical protein